MFEKFLRNCLSGDLEYEYLIRSPHGKFSIRWGIGRLIQKRLFVLPGFFIFIFLRYFKWHKFRLRHIYHWLLNKYYLKKLYISFQSGFGDMLEALPYYYYAKQKYPEHKLIAVIHHPDFCRFPEMSHCRSSFLNVGGTSIDYVGECLKTIPWIDAIHYDDCWGDGYLYGHPLLLKREFGFHFDKTSFQHTKEVWFDSQDQETGNQYLQKNNLKNGEFLSLHFKTAVPVLTKILEMIGCHQWKNQKPDILVFGTPPESVIRLLKENGFHVCDLSSSYSKGITTRQLIYIASKARLFIGGRGGFNAVYYLLDIPTINIFDLQGKQEMANGLWPQNLWEENEIGKVFWEEEPQCPQLIFNKILDYWPEG